MVNIVVWLTLGLILARLAAELWLAALNRRHVLAHAGEIPPAFRGIIDEPAYKKSIAYTLAKGRLGNFEDTCDTAVLLVVLFSGVLPWAFHLFHHGLGRSAWAMAAFLFATGLRCRCRAGRSIGTRNSGSKKNSDSTPRRQKSGGWTG